MTINIDSYIVGQMMNSIKNDDEENVIRSFKHYKKYHEEEDLERYVNLQYEKYFRTKYEFRRVRRKGQFFLVKEKK